MALVLGAAGVPTLDNFLAPGLAGRAVEQPTYPVIQARNESTTRNNTVNMFVDGSEDFQYAASVVTACVDQTIYAIQCTAAPSSLRIGSETCGPNGVVVTLTAGPSNYEWSSAITTSTLGAAVTGTFQETCNLAGTTAATCTGTLKATVPGTSTSTTVTLVLQTPSYYRYDVEITAGAEKTASPSGTCAKKSAAVGLNTKTMALWAMAGFAGIASMIAL